MNPGATTRPSASIVRRAGPLNLPSSTILPSLIPTSPWKEGIPEPSTMRPFLISRSYAIASFLIPVTPETSTPDGPDTHRNRRHRCYSLSRLEAGDLAPAAVSVHPFPDLRSRGSRIMPRYAVPAGRSLATTAAFSALLIAVGALRAEIQYDEAELAGMKKLLPALEALYATLSPAQKKTADGAFRQGPGG